MPGRLLASFVRGSGSHHSSVSTTPIHSNSSSTTSVNEIMHFGPKKTHNAADRARSPERRLSFHMDHLIHPHRDHSKDKRRSLGRAGRSKERLGKEELAQPSAKLDVLVESPPLVCYGTPSNSTGALFSGRLRVTIPESAGEVVFNEFNVRLISKNTTKKPVSSHCASCATHTEELTRWDFLTEPLHLKPGDHDFPFSYLFPGHLPASCNGALGQIEYYLQAHAHSTTDEDFNLKLPLNLRRALIPGNDKSSIRIFPPTNLTGRIVLPSVVHPIGSFPVEMTLSGVVDKNEETQTRWRLRKMMWRIEEHQKIVSTACQKHAHKIGGENKGVLHQETRIIGHNEEKSGWKTDFDTAGGEIAMQFDASINPTTNPVCDMDAPNGLEVKHNLVIELIVAEEFCPNRNTRLITPTGAARVLRMQFNLHVTERSGLGISWDEEMPPVYEAVPASPPGYFKLDDNDTRSVMEDYRGSPLPLPDYDELERMESLRLDSDSTHSSAHSAGNRGRLRLTMDDLVTEQTPPPSEPVSRAPSRSPSVDSSRL
ncbi:Arrestin domain-containing protein [Penicillium ucsense]|uniref:Arrestin domain-containing protein n=1 Tax=Penicillium ucsense TaxID=2839758 RepID=A0A8J8WBV3_9EURO|nr:Arrestin domain-containing protein [Penicillium ucsense]KAF7739387.1 Arrestin domain-containing protein [Penicillium ucsense]